MKIEYSKDTDALYIHLRDVPVAESRDVHREPACRGRSHWDRMIRELDALGELPVVEGQEVSRSASRRVSGMALQLTLTRGLAARAEPAWMAVATTSSIMALGWNTPPGNESDQSTGRTSPSMNLQPVNPWSRQNF